MQELYGYDRVRYYFEHEVLPNWFYEDDTGERMIRELQKDGAFFLWDSMMGWCRELGEEMRDEKEQYKVSVCKRTKEYSMLCIHMPNPKRELLCFQVYLVFSNDYRRRRYFTVERGASSEVRLLCAWEADGGHSNYGQCSSDAAEIERSIDEIFSNKKQKSLKKKWKLWWCVTAAVFIGAAAALYVKSNGRMDGER